MDSVPNRVPDVHQRMLAAALGYGKRGWPIFPIWWPTADGKCACGKPDCKHPGKHPLGRLVPNGLNDATTDLDTIRVWWRKYPDASVGIVTGGSSGVVVVDVDPRHGGDASFSLLNAAHGDLPNTVVSLTGGGGRHLLFAHPDVTVPTKTNIAPGIDIRGDGGYIVAPPSRHASGGRYEWKISSHPDNVAVPAMPEWLLALITQHSSPNGQSTKRFDTAAAFVGVPEGQRDDTLFRLACKLRHADVPQDMAEVLVLEAAAACKPPFPADQARRKVLNAYQRYQPLAEPLPARPEARHDMSTTLPFRTAREICTAVPVEVPWIARPWVVAGSITELDGKIKQSGKTTFLTHMARAILEGSPFMGEPTRQTPIVYLTEQPPSSFAVALRRAGLEDRDDLIVLYWRDTIAMPWKNVVAGAVKECRSRGAAVLMIDTLGQFAGVRDDAENDAGTAQQAMAPLQAAAADGLGIVVSRHERKSGGDVGDSGRGSSAYAGAADIVLSLRRSEMPIRPSIRELHALSRFDETPDRLAIELTPGGYVALGPVAGIVREEAVKRILLAAPRNKEAALQSEALSEKAGIKRSLGYELVKDLHKKDRLARLGAGKKNDPHRYWAPPDSSTRGSVMDESAEERGGQSSAVDQAPSPTGSPETMASDNDPSTHRIGPVDESPFGSKRAEEGRPSSMVNDHPSPPYKDALIVSSTPPRLYADEGKGDDGTLEDDGRRVYLLDLARVLDFPRIALGTGTLGPGEKSYRKFAGSALNNDESIDAAVAVLASEELGSKPLAGPGRDPHHRARPRPRQARRDRRPVKDV